MLVAGIVVVGKTMALLMLLLLLLVTAVELTSHTVRRSTVIQYQQFTNCIPTRDGNDWHHHHHRAIMHLLCAVAM